MFDILDEFDPFIPSSTKAEIKKRRRANNKRSRPCAVCKKKMEPVGNFKFCSDGCREKHARAVRLAARNNHRKRNRESINQKARERYQRLKEMGNHTI